MPERSGSSMHALVLLALLGLVVAPPAGAADPERHPMWPTCYRESARFVATPQERRVYAELCVGLIETQRQYPDAWFDKRDRLMKSPHWQPCWDDAKRTAPTLDHLAKGERAMACVERRERQR